MWPSKMRIEQLIAEARTFQGAIARTGRHSSPDMKMVWKSSASDLAATYTPLDRRAGVAPFQQRLKLAERQGMTLREFVKDIS